MNGERGRLVETIPLSNGLTLEAWDFSRHTAGDRCQVILACRIAVELKREYFPPTPEGETAWRELQDALGPVLFFEFQSERNFIDERERERTWKELFNCFKQDSLGYLSHPQFAKRFALARYRDLKRDPYKVKYQSLRSIFRQWQDQDPTTLGTFSSPQPDRRAGSTA